MQTRYLLLRNNKQSGPYLIDELIGQQLKSTDLIWTEGKSQAWLHPYEMEEFTPTFTKSTVSSATTNSKKETNSKTSTTERVNFDTPQYSTPVSASSSTAQTFSTHSSKPVHDNLEEEPIRFVFHKRKPTINYGHVAGSILAVTLLFIGWQRGWFPIHHTGPSESETVVVPLISSESHTAKGTQHTAHSAPIVKPQESATVLSDAPAQTTELTPVVNYSSNPVVTTTKEKKRTKKILKPIITAPVIKQEAITPDLIPAQQDDASLKTNPVPIAETANTSTEAKPDASEKKKGFGLFRGLFHKKKKDID